MDWLERLVLEMTYYVSNGTLKLGSSTLELGRYRYSVSVSVTDPVLLYTLTHSKLVASYTGVTSLFSTF